MVEATAQFPTSFSLLWWLSSSRPNEEPAILAEYSFLEGAEAARCLPSSCSSTSRSNSSQFPELSRGQSPDSSIGDRCHPFGLYASKSSLGCCRHRGRNGNFVARASMLVAFVGITACTLLLLTTIFHIDLGSSSSLANISLVEVLAFFGGDPHSLAHPFSSRIPKFSKFGQQLGDKADASLFGLRGRVRAGDHDQSVRDSDRRLFDSNKIAAATSKPAKTKFAVWLSDIHLDPFYGAPTVGTDSVAVCASHSRIVTAAEADAAPYGVLGCDPPARLWSSAVEAAKKIAYEVNTDTLLFTGDFTRHKQHFFTDPFMNVSDLIGATSDKLVDEFGYITKQSRILGTLGNDDSPRNYELNITNGTMNPWYHRLSTKFAEANAMSADRAEAYDFGGYYETKVHNVLVLNIQTIIYSAFHYPKSPMPTDPFGQLKWLRERLTFAVKNGMSAWIVGHIPPGIETYGYTPLWHHTYLKDYLAIVEDPILGKAVAAQFFGHTHTDEFRVLTGAPRGAGPLLVSGAISPIYDNNPTFRLIEYDANTGKLQNIKVFWANLSAASASKPLDWQFGYDFIGSYADLASQSKLDGGFSNEAFARLASGLETSATSRGDEWARYVAWYKALVPNDLTPLSQAEASEDNRKRALKEYFCALNVTSAKHYERCVEYELPFEHLLPNLEGPPDALEYYSKARMHHRTRVGV